MNTQNLHEKYPKLNKLLSFSTNDLAKACDYDIETDKLNIAKILDSNIEQYYKDLESKLEQEPSILSDEKQDFYRHNLMYKHSTDSTLQEIIENINELLSTIKAYNKKFDSQFYEDKIKSLESTNAKDNTENNIEMDLQSLRSLYKNALDSWQSYIDIKEQRYKRKIIRKQQKALIKRIKEWIKLMQRFHDTLESMGEYGKIFQGTIMQSLRAGLESGKWVKDYVSESDLLKAHGFNNKGGFSVGSVTTLHKRFIDFAKWLKLLESDSIKKLCDMLGRLSKTQKTLELEQYMLMQNYFVKIPTPYAKEEISGVRLGRDLENVLPQELALLDDEDFSILFDLKFSENRLFCFEKQGYENTQITQNIIVEMEKEVEEKKGPMILCVDTSGSMQGMPETIAKAMTLFFAKRAMEQHRACYIIDFGGNINTIDVTPPNGMFELMSFLEMSFYNQTECPLPALKEGMRKMQDESYKKADLLMISDFIFGDTAQIKKLMDSKDESNKCYALYVGNFSHSTIQEKIFDDEFIYNTNNHSVENLSRFMKDIRLR